MIEVLAIAQMVVGLFVIATANTELEPEPEPAAKPTPVLRPVQHPRAPNVCHPVVYDPETGGTRVDRSVDKCGRGPVGSDR